ncbi:MAG: hypothetical protein JWO57_572 [Pseudonocardiales bacterium]|nr:hypothetical protein [Pseudonocardiales bacterium]
MTAVAERSVGQLPLPARRMPFGLSRWVLVPTAVSVLNAVAFMFLRPGVNDLWAARARASAVRHGVGLTYWFSWFGGGSTPGNYSVISPYLSALLSAELVGALSAVAIVVLAAVLLRNTAHPTASTALAAVAGGINLWSGRVPFLLGTAFAVAALIAVKNQRRVPAALLTALSIASSPVSGAFLALGLAGSFVANRSHRTISATTIATVVVSLGVVGLMFGSPGPQHFSWGLCAESVGALVLFAFARPPENLRVVLWLSMFTALAMTVVPNGLGSNFGRMIWFCLPVAVVATSPRKAWIPLLLVSPILLSGANLTVTDLRDASNRIASVSYYTPLAKELDSISGLNNYRLEVVAEGAHAAYDALLNHAMLARGWETQEDNALNKTLMSRTLNATSYKIWLDNNSVGYVALPRSKVEKYPEFGLVAGGTLPYLKQIWSSADWTLYRVSQPTPIVAPPQSVLSFGQSQLVIRASCACTFSIRVRYSRYLRADPVTGRATSELADDGYGFTNITTPAPGDYVLHGSVINLFH